MGTSAPVLWKNEPHGSCNCVKNCYYLKNINYLLLILGDFKHNSCKSDTSRVIRTHIFTANNETCYDMLHEGNTDIFLKIICLFKINRSAGARVMSNILGDPTKTKQALSGAVTIFFFKPVTHRCLIQGGHGLPVFPIILLAPLRLGKNHPNIIMAMECQVTYHFKVFAIPCALVIKFKLICVP